MSEAILAAALDLMETHGPDALSVRQIAAAAGVAPMGVYNHFSSKSGVVEALFVQGFERLGEAMRTLVTIDDPEEALLEAGRVYRQLALRHPLVYRVMFLQAVPGFEPSDAAKEVACGAFEGLVAAVQRAMKAGVVAKDDPELVAQVLWSAIHGWVSLELFGIGIVEDTDGGAEHLLHALLDGIRPRHGRVAAGR